MTEEILQTFMFYCWESKFLKQHINTYFTYTKIKVGNMQAEKSTSREKIL